MAISSCCLPRILTDLCRVIDLGVVWWEWLGSFVFITRNALVEDLLIKRTTPSLSGRDAPALGVTSLWTALRKFV